MFSYRRIGGLRFLKLGRFTITIACTAKGGEARKRKSRKAINRANKAQAREQGFHIGYRTGAAEIASRHLETRH
ncbi:hypothetical protein [Labrys neptuniae]